MKKVFIIGALFCTLLMTGCGCGKKEMKKISCNTKHEFEDYTYNSDYTITYNADDKLLNYIREESYISDDKELLSSTLEFKKSIFDELNKIEYYNFESKIVDNQLTTKLSINFEEIDNEELLEKATTYESYYNDTKKQFDINLLLEDFADNNINCKE